MTMTIPYRLRSQPLENIAKRHSPSKMRPLFLPLPLGEGWGEGLPVEAPLITQPLQVNATASEHTRVFNTSVVTLSLSKSFSDAAESPS